MEAAGKFLVILDSFFEPRRRHGFNRFLTLFWFHFGDLGQRGEKGPVRDFGDLGQTRENQPAGPDGLAREEYYILIHGFRRICRYIGLSICRYVDISVYLYRLIDMSICRIDMSIYRFIYIGLAICRYVDKSVSV